MWYLIRLLSKCQSELAYNFNLNTFFFTFLYYIEWFFFFDNRLFLFMYGYHFIFLAEDNEFRSAGTLGFWTTAIEMTAARFKIVLQIRSSITDYFLLKCVMRVVKCLGMRYYFYFYCFKTESRSWILGFTKSNPAFKKCACSFQNFYFLFMLISI